MSHPEHQANSETEFMVCRKVRIATPDVSEAQLRLVEKRSPDHLSLAIDSYSGELRITYDSSVLSFSQILAWLSEADLPPINTWWFRLQSSFYDFTDSNAAAQAHARPKGCCNKIPKG